MKKIAIYIITSILTVSGTVFFLLREEDDLAGKIDVTPIPRMYGSPSASPSSTKLPQATTEPVDISEVNLAVPFTVQAPHANWEDPYGDFCEEASVLMAVSYIKNLAIPDADFADQKLKEIMNFEIQRFGYHVDTTAEETTVIIKEFYGINKVRTVYDPTEASIKKSLADGMVVIVPAAGQQLGNPYFRAPGPLYHMLVIKGYTKDGNFITNDPGTRRGADFIYSPGVIMNAIHDWNGGDVLNGKKVVIIVG